MLMQIKKSVLVAFLVVMSLALSVSSVLGQEEVDAATEATTAGPGWMIAIIGAGILVILGLGMAMSAQQADEQQSN